jgi:hypothetical protein
MSKQSTSRRAQKLVPMEGDGFVTRPSPSRMHQKRELNKMILAHSDIRDAYEASFHFLNIVKLPSHHQSGLYAGMDHPLYTPLLSAIIVSYAKPFTDNQGLGVLKKHWRQFAHSKWAESHDRILKARHELYAHSDAQVRSIKIHPPGAQKLLSGKTTNKVGYAIRGYIFTYNEIQIIADLSYDLARRLHAEVERLIDDLYEGMELPAKEFWLRLDDGL